MAGSVVLLLVGGFLAWRSHEESLLGQLSLSTSGPSLVAEVLDKDDRPVVPSIPVPSSQPVVSRRRLRYATKPANRTRALAFPLSCKPPQMWYGFSLSTEIS